MATTGDETLADEQRSRIPAAVAAIAAGILTLVGGAVTTMVFSDRPTVPVLDALREHLGGALSGPGLKARQVLWVDENAVKVLLLGLLLALAAVAIGVALAYLHRSIKARRPELRGIFGALVLGTALVSVASVAQSVGSVLAASTFADAADQSASAARDAQASPAVLAAGLMQVVGVFALAFAFVLLALNGMRVGLLTRFMGVLGMIVGALFIFPLGAASLPLVQSFWLVALGVLFLGRWPSGMPPAWESAEARPWPTQQELREARLEKRAGDEERPRRAGRRERAEPPETPAPELPERRPHPSSKKKKRKRR